MLWKIIVVRDSAEILAALILIGAGFFTYKLLKDDKGPIWNFVLIAISFLALSAIFSVIEEFFVTRVYNILKYIFMMLSSIIFAAVLMSVSIRDKYIHIKK